MNFVEKSRQSKKANAKLKSGIFRATDLIEKEQ